MVDAPIEQPQPEKIQPPPKKPTEKTSTPPQPETPNIRTEPEMPVKITTSDLPIINR